MDVDRELRELKLQLEVDPKNLDLLKRYLGLRGRMGYLSVGDLALNSFDIKMMFKEKNDRKDYLKFMCELSLGDPSWVAYDMFRRDDDKSFVEYIIERSKVGTIPMLAYLMAKNHGSNREWAERVIARAEELGLSEPGKYKP